MLEGRRESLAFRGGFWRGEAEYPCPSMRGSFAENRPRGIVRSAWGCRDERYCLSATTAEGERRRGLSRTVLSCSAASVRVRDRNMRLSSLLSPAC